MDGGEFMERYRQRPGRKCPVLPLTLEEPVDELARSVGAQAAAQKAPRLIRVTSGPWG
jgi:CheY-like chemotaxis protein